MGRHSEASAPGLRRFADELSNTLDAMLFASPSHRTRERVADGLATLDRSAQDLVLHWAQVVAQNSPELAWQLCARAPALLGKPGVLDREQFASWVKAILAQRDGESGEPDWLDDAGGFLAQASDSARVPLTAIARRLGLFIRGLGAGDRVLQAMAADQTVASTDGEAIFLPAQASVGASVETTVRYYRQLAAMLWGYGAYGSLALANDDALLAMNEPELARRWFDCLEFVRVRAALLRDYPGLAESFPEPPPLDGDLLAFLSRPGASADDSLAQISGLFARSIPPSTLWSATMDFSVLRARGEGHAGKQTEPLRRLANVFRADGRGGKPGERHGQALDAGVSDEHSQGQQGPDAGAKPVDPAAVQSALAKPPPGGTLMPAGAGRWQAANAAEEASALVAGEVASRCYDEWDYLRGAYRRQWCKVFLREGPAGDLDWVVATTARHARAIRQIRRRFESLRGEERWQRRQLDGSELDLDAWVDATADARTGREIDPRLFRRRMTQERSLAVVFMVDMSGSTKGWVNEAEREALVMLCEAIEALGDSYAICGFSGWTHQRCDIYRIKDFAEGYSAEVKARIAGIEACDYTRMGPAIRHLTDLLSQRAERHKLLVTISDGRPDDFGDLYRGRYGIEDTRRALQEARHAGVRSYCVTVDRHAADYLPQLYGTANYSVLADPKTLPLRIAQVYRRLVA